MITAQGSLYMMGANHKGQLGFEGASVTNSPTLVESFKHFKVT